MDVSGVTDFSYAFSKDRNQAGGSYVINGNPKATTFVGTAISKWNTASATSLDSTFYGASEMNADLTGWKVGKVVTLQSTFYGAVRFTGTGVDTWNIAKARLSMSNTFQNAVSLTTCNKRKIADAWKSSAVFVATTYDTDWTADTCTVRFKYRGYALNGTGKRERAICLFVFTFTAGGGGSCERDCISGCRP